MASPLQIVPALKPALLFVVGILLGRLFSVPLVPAALLTVVCLVCTVAILLASQLPNRMYVLASLCAFLCMSVGVTKYVHDSDETLALPPEMSKAQVGVSGWIEGPPTVVGNRMRFVLKGERIISGGENATLPVNILVTIIRGRSDTALLPLEYGTMVGLRGKLERPSAERNPGEFNARQYYEANGISLFLLVKGWNNVVVLDTGGGWWVMRKIVVPVRRYMFALIDRTIGGEEGEFLKGIFLGERSGISPSVRESFTNSGTAHVLAVSGSNVAVVTGFFFVLLGFLRMGRLPRVILTACGLLFYMMITGSNPPVVRATIMALVLLFSSVAQEKTNPFNGLGIAALIILAFDTRQLFDVGFQLSFVAVLSIMYLYPKADALINRLGNTALWRRATAPVLKVCALSGVATLGTLPLTSIYFGKFSIIGIVANMFVIPGVGLSVVLGGLSGIGGMASDFVAQTYASCNSAILWLTIRVAEISGRLSFAYVHTLRFAWVDALVFYTALLVAVHWKRPLWRNSLIILLLITLNIAVWVPPPQAMASVDGKLRVSFIDVGQGDAVLVELPSGGTILVDAGPRTHTFDAGERIVTPFLKRRGITNIDLLVISHAHSDHVGGAAAVISEISVQRVLDSGQPARSTTYESYLRSIRERGSVFEMTKAGTLLSDFAGARLYVLYPSNTFLSNDPSRSHPNLNNTSVVFKLVYGGISFLFSGDAEKEAEEEMVHVYGDFLQSTLLKIGHHGSTTSTSPEFLASVNPQHAVISVGRNNKFRHPSPLVIERLMEREIEISRTDEEGAIVFETDGVILERVGWR